MKDQLTNVREREGRRYSIRERKDKDRTDNGVRNRGQEESKGNNKANEERKMMIYVRRGRGEEGKRGGRRTKRAGVREASGDRGQSKEEAKV